jgi:hypothetical protein
MAYTLEVQCKLLEHDEEKGDNRSISEESDLMLTTKKTL